MRLIPEEDARQLHAHLERRLVGPVTIDHFTRPGSRVRLPGRAGSACEDTRRLLEELAELSERIRLRVHGLDGNAELAASLGVDRAPATVLGGAAKGRVCFLGIPAGYEFGSFIEEVIDVGNGRTDLSEGTKQALRGLDEAVHIRVFVTPGCPFCPAAAKLAHKMAVESGKVSVDVVEAGGFPDLVARYRVGGVPKVVLNDRIEFVGALPEARFLERVLRAVA